MNDAEKLGLIDQLATIHVTVEDAIFDVKEVMFLRRYNMVSTYATDAAEVLEEAANELRKISERWEKGE